MCPPRAIEGCHRCARPEAAASAAPSTSAESLRAGPPAGPVGTRVLVPVVKCRERACSLSFVHVQMRATAVDARGRSPPPLPRRFGHMQRCSSPAADGGGVAVKVPLAEIASASRLVPLTTVEWGTGEELPERVASVTHVINLALGDFSLGTHLRAFRLGALADSLGLEEACPPLLGTAEGSDDEEILQGEPACRIDTPFMRQRVRIEADECVAIPKGMRPFHRAAGVSSLGVRTRAVIELKILGFTALIAAPALCLGRLELGPCCKRARRPKVPDAGL
ncbi:hypothetical protein T492DRAFT_1138995 [Pavlovales sp. CCMP2436]|nr:hypothetical protein T492DRAFT_1138995 [Pavlovales sp. CCMP2436]